MMGFRCEAWNAVEPTWSIRSTRGRRRSRAARPPQRSAGHRIVGHQFDHADRSRDAHVMGDRNGSVAAASVATSGRVAARRGAAGHIDRELIWRHTSAAHHHHALGRRGVRFNAIEAILSHRQVGGRRYAAGRASCKFGPDTQPFRCRCSLSHPSLLQWLCIDDHRSISFQDPSGSFRQICMPLLRTVAERPDGSVVVTRLPVTT